VYPILVCTTHTYTHTHTHTLHYTPPPTDHLHVHDVYTGQHPRGRALHQLQTRKHERDSAAHGCRGEKDQHSGYANRRIYVYIYIYIYIYMCACVCIYIHMHPTHSLTHSGMYNLSLAVTRLEGFADECPIRNLRETFSELRQTTDLFLSTTFSQMGMYVCVYVCMCVVRVCLLSELLTIGHGLINICISLHTHTLTCPHTHTHTHTHTFSHTQGTAKRVRPPFLM
jgi:hypothetical protein